MRIRVHAEQCGCMVVGGNTAGIISPEECNVGIIPRLRSRKVRGNGVAIGSMIYYVADTLTRSGYGESTCVGLGGDPVLAAPSLKSCRFLKLIRRRKPLSS